uniref:GATA transcription factor n=1 Tax=Cajanus cajan TaxID=3821 RepID=A0A151TDM1_CAJCA|nr:GATA transcription factor 13 [Cajanus cajan]
MEAHEFFHNSFSDNPSAADHFIVEDFFDFSNDEDAATTLTDSLPAHAVTPADTTTNCNFPAAQDHFSGDLSVPYDDLAELEWLSKFAEESFSSEDLQKLQLISGVRVESDGASSERREASPVLGPAQGSVPGKARSKRSRGDWASRLVAPRRREGAEGGAEGRKCLHCATDKTPQWRTGPMGPKTLCNACGVRYKSGRLVPEYRPAASPTFVLTKHSNSHFTRILLHLLFTQQQQQLLHLQHQQNVMFDVSSSSNADDYLIHHPLGPHFTNLI